jgi:hypothetical protein
LNLDKLINNNKLFERLDKLYPGTTSKDKNDDGINYWKGKKIVSLAEWRKIVNFSTAFQKGLEYQNTKEALQYFPDDYQRFPLFPLGVEDELIHATNIWWKEYIGLMEFRKNPNYLAIHKRIEEENDEDEAEEEAWDQELAKHGFTYESLSDPNNSERVWALFKRWSERKRQQEKKK